MYRYIIVALMLYVNEMQCTMDGEEDYTQEFENNEVFNKTAVDTAEDIYQTKKEYRMEYDDSFIKATEIPSLNEDLRSSILIDYPYSVSIQRLGSHYSNGVLLDKRWILTVGSEFFNIREALRLFRARLGSLNCKNGGILVPLKQVHIHPAYVPGKPNYDLALLRTGVSVEYTDYIRPISLSNNVKKMPRSKFTTVYWPRLIINGHPISRLAKERVNHNLMRVSTQQMVPKDKCAEKIPKTNALMDSTLCLAPITNNHSACMPDVGAPVVGEDGLWGIISSWTSKKCRSSATPVLFTYIAAPTVRAWLDSQMFTF